MHKLTDIHGGAAREVFSGPGHMLKRKLYDHLQQAKKEKHLDKLIKINGKIYTYRDAVKMFVETGAKLETREVNKIKEMGRMRYFRSNNQQQEAHERKISEGGTKTEYLIVTSDGFYYELGKIAYDYAAHVASRAPARVTVNA